MNTLNLEGLELLIKLHSPVLLSINHLDAFRHAQNLENIPFTKSDLNRDLSILTEEQVNGVFEIADSRLRWKELIEVLGDVIISQYPSIESKSEGGYILPSQNIPMVLLNKAVHNAAATNVTIINENRYRSYDDQHNMLVEMVVNAYEHGNKYNPNKVVYLLWHKCGSSREIMILDQGTEKLDMGKAHQNRTRLAGTFGKSDDYSGIDLLKAYSKYYQFFSVQDNQGSKKGTLLKIGLSIEQEVKNPEKACSYIGHHLLKI
jgi:hypothetical protein